VIGSHQVAKLQNMVENTRQRLNDLRHSQKTVDRSYSLLQVRRLKKEKNRSKYDFVYLDSV
jgi:hypothetical protein